MREIQVEVRGQFVYKSSKLGGVQGEGNASRMRIRLDDSWSGYAKRIVWRDARGLCPTAVVLGADQMTGENTPLDYTVSIPPEPLAVAGWCCFAIEGYTEQEDGTVTAALTAEDRLEVLAGGYGQPAEPTVSQALQLQHEIDGMIGTVQESARAARESCTQAQAAAQTAAAEAADAIEASAAAGVYGSAAAQAAQTALEEAGRSESWAVGGTGLRAGEDTDNARYWAEQAHLAAGGGVRSFNGRSGAVLPVAGDYTAAQVGAVPVERKVNQKALGQDITLTPEDIGAAGSGHGHAASDVTAGTLAGRVEANAAAQQELTAAQVRNIKAGITDLTAGTSTLATGTLYLVYEEA